MAERTEILNIQVNYDDAIQKIGNFADEINRSKQDQKLFREELKNGQITQKEYAKSMEESNAVIKVNNDSIRSLRKEIQNNIKVENEQEGSLKSLRAQLSNTTKAFDELSKKEREGAKGTQLRDHIKNLTAELSIAEEESGRFQRNVGNYPDVFSKAAAGGNSFAQSILQQANAGQGLIPILKGMGTQILAIGKAIVANPIGAIITAVVVVFMALKKAIETSEEATNSLTRIMAPFKRILDAVLYVLQILVEGLLKGAEAVMGLYRAISKLSENLPIVGQYMKEFNDEVDKSIQLEKDRQQLAKDERKFTEDNAKAQRDIAELRAKAQDKENYTAQQRLEFIKEANKIEQENADTSLKLAKERLRTAEVEAERMHGNAETEKELSQLRADVYNTEKQHSETRRKLLREENTFRDEIASDEKKRADVAKKAIEESIKNAKERAAAELSAARSLEDGLLTLIEDERQKQRQTIEISYSRQIEDLQKRLNTEKNLTIKARKDINELIKNLEDQKNKDLNKLDEDQVKKNYEIALQNINNRLAAIKSESAEFLALRIDALNKERDMELMAAEKLGTDKALINAKYNKQIADEQKKANEDLVKRAISESQLRFENDLKQAELEGKQTFQLRLDAKKAEIDALQQMDGESAEMFLQRQRKLNLDLNDLQQQQSEYSAQQLEARITATATMFGALSELSSEFAEQSEALGVFSKAMALFEIALSQGTAIAKGIAQAQSVPFPGNIAAIATTVATIMAGITSALKVVKGTTVPKSTGTESRQGQVSYFAKGGLVTGEGTGTSDSVPSMLSNGEAVMTARTVSLFGSTLSALNQLGGGVPIQTGSQGAGDMALNAITESAIAKALANQKAPIVQVVDIQRGIRKSEVRDTNRTVS